MNPLIIATRNPGKLEEIRQILGPEIQLRSLADFADLPGIVEDGDTFEANAVKRPAPSLAIPVVLPWPMIPAWRWMRSAALPASTPPVFAGEKSDRRTEQRQTPPPAR